MKRKYKRTRLLVDPSFQLRLGLRMCLYLLLYVFIVLIIAFVLQCLEGIASDGHPRTFVDFCREFFFREKGILHALLLAMPLCFYNLLKFSNRVAGPLYRCRKVMQEMATGKPVPEFTPRQHDLMPELFQAFNCLIREWNARAGSEGNGRLGETSGEKGITDDLRPNSKEEERDAVQCLKAQSAPLIRSSPAPLQTPVSHGHRR
jgi:hypothetical protein